jgi:hypothetical protein
MIDLKPGCTHVVTSHTRSATNSRASAWSAQWHPKPGTSRGLALRARRHRAPHFARDAEPSRTRSPPISTAAPATGLPVEVERGTRKFTIKDPYGNDSRAGRLGSVPASSLDIALLFRADARLRSTLCGWRDVRCGTSGLNSSAQARATVTLAWARLENPLPHRPGFLNALRWRGGGDVWVSSPPRPRRHRRRHPRDRAGRIAGQSAWARTRTG